jgi:hypothetical protein
MYILFVVMISGYGFDALTALQGTWRSPGRALTAIGTVAGNGVFSLRIAILNINPIVAAHRRGLTLRLD